MDAAHTSIRRRAAAAGRQRRARERRRRGKVIYRLEVNVFSIVKWLIVSGRLDELQASSHRLVEHELERVLAELCRCPFCA